MRWQWLMLMAVLAAGLTAAPQAEANLPAPVCRLPTVVDVMTQELLARWHYAEIKPDLIQERPTADGNLMRCGVCVGIGLYDMARYGDQPLARCEPHVFSVQAVRNGFVVRYLQ